MGWSAMQTVTRYAKSGDVHIAYQVFGEGPVDVIAVLPFVSNIETFWDEPELARWLRYLGGRVRLTMFDKLHRHVGSGRRATRHGPAHG